MTLTIVLLIAGVVIAAAFFVLAKGSRLEDRPGPHNNWRRTKSTIKSSGWVESGEGINGNGGGGYGGGGGD